MQRIYSMKVGICRRIFSNSSLKYWIDRNFGVGYSCDIVFVAYTVFLCRRFELSPATIKISDFYNLATATLKLINLMAQYGTNHGRFRSFHRQWKRSIRITMSNSGNRWIERQTLVNHSFVNKIYNLQNVKLLCCSCIFVNNGTRRTT